MTDFREQIIALRAKRGLTQGAMAKKMGVTQATLSRIENGVTHPTLKTLTSIAEVLQASVVLVPYEQLPAQAGTDQDLSDDKPAGSVFDDVFIPDPGEDE